MVQPRLIASTTRQPYQLFATRTSVQNQDDDCCASRWNVIAMRQQTDARYWVYLTTSWLVNESHQDLSILTQARKHIVTLSSSPASNSNPKTLQRNQSIVACFECLPSFDDETNRGDCPNKAASHGARVFSVYIHVQAISFVQIEINAWHTLLIRTSDPVFFSRFKLQLIHT